MIKEHRSNHSSGKDRWLISYADFITLLFAFFVVMYAISSVNDGKYKTLSDTLEQIFEQPLGSMAKFLSNLESDDEQPSFEQTVKEPTIEEEQQDTLETEEVALDILAEKAKYYFKGLINDGTVSMLQEQNWLEIEIKSNILFSEGSAFLAESAAELIRGFVEILKTFNNPITIEGFTDNTPINNDIYPSNWELSSNRATSVVRLLAEQGIYRSRLAAIGYGENFPIASNDIDAGRAQNRRIVFLIEKNNTRRAYLLNNSVEEYDMLNYSDDDLEPSRIFELQKEIVIEPKMPTTEHDSDNMIIKGIKTKDGTTRFNFWGIKEKEGETE